MIRLYCDFESLVKQFEFYFLSNKKLLEIFELKGYIFVVEFQKDNCQEREKQEKQEVED